jgi:hypothetical protein
MAIGTVALSNTAKLKARDKKTAFQNICAEIQGMTEAPTEIQGITEAPTMTEATLSPSVLPTEI